MKDWKAMAQHDQEVIEQVISAIADRLGAGRRRVKREFNLSFFTFNIEFLPAAFNAFTNGNFIVQNDSAFVVTRTSYITALPADNKTPVNVVTIPAPATTIVTQGLNAPFLVNIVDSGSGRQFSNIDTHIDNWFGSAERPFFWPSPQVLDPNSTISMRLQSLDLAINWNVRCAFHGFKVFGNVAAFKDMKAI